MPGIASRWGWLPISVPFYCKSSWLGFPLQFPVFSASLLFSIKSPILVQEHSPLVSSSQAVGETPVFFSSVSHVTLQDGRAPVVAFSCGVTSLLLYGCGVRQPTRWRYQYRIRTLTPALIVTVCGFAVPPS